MTQEKGIFEFDLDDMVSYTKDTMPIVLAVVAIIIGGVLIIEMATLTTVTFVIGLLFGLFCVAFTILAGIANRYNH